MTDSASNANNQNNAPEYEMWPSPCLILEESTLVAQGFKCEVPSHISIVPKHVALTDRITVGRSSNAGLLLVSPAISRMHAVITRNQNGEYDIMDTNSSNGVYVNGYKLVSSEKVVLADGDKIRFCPYNQSGVTYVCRLNNTNKRAFDEMQVENIKRSKSDAHDRSYWSPASPEPEASQKDKEMPGPSGLKTTNLAIVRAKPGPSGAMENISEVTPQKQQLMEEKARLEEKLREYEKKLNCTEEGAKQNKEHNYDEGLQGELQCSICSELFIKAMTINCAHSFCTKCINEWKKMKKDCPICRKAITTMTPSLVLDSCVSKLVETLSAEEQATRIKLVAEREAAAKAKVATRKSARTAERTQRREASRVTPQQIMENFLRGLPPQPPVEIPSSPLAVSSDAISISSDSDTSMSPHTSSFSEDWVDDDEDAEYQLPGNPRGYYGGYGACFTCGLTGHWSNGCPYR